MAKIVIDAGHGRFTSGKRCLKELDKNETREWILNDSVSDYLEKYLKEAGHTVKRVDDFDDGKVDVPLSKRVKKANEWGADLYLSIHHNAGINGGNGGGVVVYTSKECSNKSKVVQESVYRNIIFYTGMKGNRADGTLSENFYVVRKTKMPAVLIECGFMDSKSDIKKILSPSCRQKMAKGIAEGVIAIYGGKIPPSISSSFLVRVKVDELNVRKYPDPHSEKTGVIKNKGTFTITQIKKYKDGGTWGKLKSGLGWINISNRFVTRL